MSAIAVPNPSPEIYELSITRFFNAPRAMVCEAFVDAEHAKQWMGPRGFSATHLQLDVRPGERWRACLHQVGEWNGKTFPDLWQGGVYREVTPPERLVYTFSWEGQGGLPTRETLVTIIFSEVDAETTRMNFHQASFDSVEQRDGHSQGWNSEFDRFSEFVNQSKPTL